MSELTFEQFVARVNASGFLPKEDPTGRVRVMAQKVKLHKGKEFVFREPVAGGTPKYPWDEWFDGTLWMLERSDGPENEKGTIEHPTEARDFGVPVNAMVPKLHTAARRRYKVVQISRFDAEGNRLKNALIIKARDMTPDERVAEDQLRAKEKKAAKQRKRDEIEEKNAAVGGPPSDEQDESAA